MANLILVHLPIHASWLNQIEIVVSIIQRKVLTPNDFESLQTVVDRVDAFEGHYNQIAKPFDGTQPGSDQRYRGSLATDLMEPARPAADRLVLNLLESDPLRRGDIVETREGVCRVGEPLAQRLARHAGELRTAVAPHAEQLARTLLKAPEHPTPLTRGRHEAAATRRRQAVVRHVKASS